MQIILVSTYVGCSDFVFEVECSGKCLSRLEVLERGLLTQDQKRRHKDSAYVYAWYQVFPGDTISIKHCSDDFSHQVTFRVPENGMENPNSNIDNLFATDSYLEDHLALQCELVSKEEI